MMKKVLSLALAVALAASAGAASFGASTPTSGQSRHQSDGLTIWQKEILDKIVDENKEAGNRSLTNPQKNRALAMAENELKKDYINSGYEYSTFEQRVYNKHWDGNPNQAVSGKTATKSGVKASFKTSDSVKTYLEKWFTNKLWVTQVDEAGKYSFTADREGMDSNKLVFYSYNTNTNTYLPISNTAHYLDDEGNLHFTTNVTGYIIISEGTLNQ